MASDRQFTVFRNLPSEIRVKIWKDALPGRGWVLEPLIFAFKPGCWEIKTNSTPSYRDDVPEPFIESSWKFDDSLLDKPRCKVTIGAVNREAREVAIAWVRTLGGAPNKSLNPIFIRPFVGGCDSLYVSAKQWKGFAYETTVKPGHYLRELCHITTNITRLVLPESVIRIATPSQVRRAFLFFQQIREVHIIPDDGDDGAVSGQDGPGIRGHSLEPKLGGYAFSWRREARSFLSLFPMMARREKMAGYIDEFLRQLAPALERVPRLEVRNAAVGPHINDSL